MIATVFTNLSLYYPGVSVDTYIVMPDHFHGIVVIEHAKREDNFDKSNDCQANQTKYSVLSKRDMNNSIFHEQQRIKQVFLQYLGRSQRDVPAEIKRSCHWIIGRFKSYTTIQYINGVKSQKWKPFYERLWQKGYYDRIINNKYELFAVRKYICDNPLNWNKP
jgi:REP element-mobilizing transposase RayT